MIFRKFICKAVSTTLFDTVKLERVAELFLCLFFFFFDSEGLTLLLEGGQLRNLITCWII